LTFESLFADLIVGALSVGTISAYHGARIDTLQSNSNTVENGLHP